MDLQSNHAAHFTKWVIAEGLLKTPFVLVDVGVQGGENERWHALGDHLVVHGFDAIQEVVDGLKAENQGRANRHFHCMAAGDFDGEQTLYFDAGDPFASSLYQPGESRFTNAAPTTAQRSVPIRRLDSLLSEGVIPRADFLKIDVEGYEKNVLSGAPELLKGILGFEAETTFNVSPEYPKTHFGMLLDVALANHLRVFDIEFNRVPRVSFQNALSRENRPIVSDQISVGSPATLNVLFCRNSIEEVDSRDCYESLPVPLEIDGLIKQIIVYELYGLNDVALDTVQRFAGRLSDRIDVGKAVHLLVDPECRVPGPLIARVRQLQAQVEQVQKAHEDSMAQAKRQFDVHRQAAVSEIEKLRSQVERLHKAHPDAMANAKRQFDAHRQAAVTEIEKLRSQLEQLHKGHSDAMANAKQQFDAHRQVAAVETQLAQMERSYSTKPDPLSVWPEPTEWPHIATAGPSVVLLGRVLQTIGIIVPRPLKRLIKTLPVWRRYFGSGVGL